MYCIHCGKYLIEDQPICPYCGKKQMKNIEKSTEEDVEKNIEKSTEENVEKNIERGIEDDIEKSLVNEKQQDCLNNSGQKDYPKRRYRMSKRKVIVLSLLLVIVLCCIGISKYVNSPITKLAAALEKNDVDGITVFYEQVEKAEDFNKARKLMLAYANDVKEAYINKDTHYDYETTIFVLQKFMNNNYGIQDQIEMIIEEIGRINDSRVSYENGMACLENEDYIDAMDYFAYVIEEDLENKHALGEAYSQVVALIKKDAASKIAAENYGDAYAIVYDGLDRLLYVMDEEDKNYQELESFYSEIASSIEKDAKEKLAQKNYEEAYDKVYDGLRYFSDDTGLMTLQTQILSKWKEDTLERIESLKKKKDIEGILSLLNEFQVRINDDEINELISLYEKFIPASLFNVEVYENNCSSTYFTGSYAMEIGESMTDTYGNTYDTDTVARLVGSYDKGSYGSGVGGELVFLNNEGYDHISGTLAYENCEKTDGSLIFQIYADDQLVYESPVITNDTKPFDFDVEISPECHKYALFWTSTTQATMGAWGAMEGGGSGNILLICPKIYKTLEK